MLPAVLLHRLISQHMRLSSPAAMILGYLRYEAVRKLNPRQFAELQHRNLKGENFDEMIDVLVMANEKGQTRRADGVNMKSGADPALSAPTG